jgi:alcohol dehydrogenase class IV
MDALTHAIEGYTTLGAWELTDALHLKAIKIIATSLPGSARGDDSEDVPSSVELRWRPDDHQAAFTVSS